MSRQHQKEKAVQLYAFFLKFYPQRYRHSFGSQMLQTFKDHYTDSVKSDEHAGTRFWFDVVSEEVRGILLVVLIFCGIAGYAAARQTGQMKTGTYAGLFTGLLSIVIGMSALFVITFVFLDIIRQNAFMLYDFQRSGLKSIDQFIIEDAMGAALVGTLFSLVAGGIFGTLGGYLGRTVKERR